MEKKDEIYRKRLERIRDDLNRYISYIDLPIPALEMPKCVLSSFSKILTPEILQQAEEDGVPSPGPVPQFSMNSGVRPKLDAVLAQKEESFSEMLLRMIDERGWKDSDVYRRADIDRRLFAKIRSDAEYVPSKKTAISFCLAMGLELGEAKKLLATAGYTLSASSRFDLIITYLIEHNEYNIHFANIVLDDYGEGTLSR